MKNLEVDVSLYVCYVWISVCMCVYVNVKVSI